MDDDHFGLTTRPFQLTPDPRFWFSTATHRKAMAYLGYGLAQGEGFIVITGEIGAGKTTLAGHLVETIDPQRLNVLRLVSTAIHADDLLRTVATALGIDPAGLAKAQLLTAIERGLHAVARTGRRTLLVVDEVQALPVDSLEELRMLSNFQAGSHAILQILLLGQPEFRDRLHGSDALEQMRQRVIAIHHLDPMGADEVEDYIAHRLGVAGWQGRPDFAADAFPAFHRGSGGVPRRLNQLAARTMLAAAIEGRDLIDAALVEGVLGDLHADLPLPDVAVGSVAPIAAPEPPPESIEPGADEAEDAVFERAPADPVPAPTADDPVLAARVAELEARVEQQDAALRRVLTLLVDWVDADQSRAGFGPIRGPAAWNAAA